MIEQVIVDNPWLLFVIAAMGIGEVVALYIMVKGEER